VTRPTMKILPLLALLAASLSVPARAAAPTPPPPRHYVIVLRLVPRLHADAAWTAADNATLTAHFQRLQQATAAGQVLLAGRTTEPGDRTFGLVVFAAADDAAARAFLADDPCVAGGLMTGEVHPFHPALVRTGS